MGKAVGGIVGAVGSYYGAKRAADAARDAGIRSEQARQRAMEEARFKPFAMTTKFGTATPEFDAQGRLSGYTYGATPLYAGYQTQLDRPGQLAMEGIQRAAALQPQFEQAGQGLFGLAGQFLPTGTTPQLTAAEQEYLSGVQGLGRQLYGVGTGPSADVLAQQARLQGFAGQLTPSSDLTAAEQAYLGRTGAAAENILGGMSTQAAADVARQQGRLEQLAGQVTPTAYDPSARARGIFEEEMALLQPERRRTEQRLAATTFGRGRGGLSVGAEGQPELFGLGQAYAEQEARAAADAKQRARAELLQDIGMGTQLGQSALAAGQAGRQEQLGLTSTGLNLIGAQQTAEEDARQRMLQNMGLSAQFGGQAITTGQAGQQYAQQQALQGLNLLGAAMSPEEQARQRMLQNIQTGTGLYSSGAGLFGTGYNLQGTAYQPFLQALQTQQAIETAAQQPMNLGVDLGQRVSDAGYRIGTMDLTGTGAANQYYMTQGGLRGGALAGLGQGLGSAIGGMSNPFSATANNSTRMNIGVANSGLFGTNMFNRQFTQGSTLGNNTGGYSFY